MSTTTAVAIYAAFVASGGLASAADASNALTFASINGTIITIVFAALSGYGLIVFQSYDAMVKELVDRGNEVLQDSHIGYIAYQATQEDQDAFKALTLSEQDDALWLVGCPNEVKLSDELVIPANDLTRKGRLLIYAGQMLLSEGPFSSTTRFADRADIEKWLPKANEVMRVLRNAFVDRTLHVEFEKLMTAADEDKEDYLQGPLSNKTLTQRSRAFIEEGLTMHARRLEAVQAKILDYTERLRDIDRRLERIDRYRMRVIPSKPLTAAICLAIVTVFACGVFAPMIDQHVSAFVSAWVPLGIYAAGLVLASIYVWRKSPQ